MPKRKRTKSNPSSTFDVTQDEHDSIVKALRGVNWEKCINTSRKNVIPEDAPKGSKGKQYCHSFILGPVMKDPEKKPSFWTTENPELYDLLKKLMARHDPKHTFTNITINKNLKCKPHKDRGNNGKSYIVGFGEYTGGELSLEIEPKSFHSKKKSRSEVKPQVQTRSLYRKFVEFYGGEQKHWTEDFKGERYTCVFYNFPELHVNAAKLKDKAVANPIESEFAKKLAQLSKKLKKNQKGLFKK